MFTIIKLNETIYFKEINDERNFKYDNLTVLLIGVASGTASNNIGVGTVTEPTQKGGNNGRD